MVDTSMASAQLATKVTKILLKLAVGLAASKDITTGILQRIRSCIVTMYLTMMAFKGIT